MNINHYPSKELCKKLTAIGFPPTEYSSTIYHMHTLSTQGNVTIEVDDSKDPIFYFMPNVMELLEVIPQRLHDTYWLETQMQLDEMENDSKYWCVRYREPGSTRLYSPSFNDGFPNALAEMILWLHENKFISFGISYVQNN